MKKIHLYILLMLFLSACGAGTEVSAFAVGTAYATMPLAPSMTPTVEPTPTVGYQATAVVAQQTADAAMRLNVAVTSEHEQRVLEAMQMTAAVESQNFLIVGWTATAALTAVPATQTQQAVLNTQIPAQQELMSAALTATIEAPTQLVAMSRAENEVKNAPLDFLVRMFAYLGFSFGMICLGIYAVMNIPKAAQEKAEVKDAPDIVPIDLVPVVDVMVRKDTETPYPSGQRMVIPCTPEQFSVFVDGILSGLKTFAFGQWTGKDSPFTAQEYKLVRRALLVHRLVQSIPPDGRLMLTEDGDSVFRGWLDRNELGGGFEFGEATGPLPQAQS